MRTPHLIIAALAAIALAGCASSSGGGGGGGGGMPGDRAAAAAAGCPAAVAGMPGGGGRRRHAWRRRKRWGRNARRLERRHAWRRWWIERHARRFQRITRYAWRSDGDSSSSKSGLPGESGDGESSSGSSGDGKSGSSSSGGSEGSGSAEGAGGANGGAQTSEERRQSGEKNLDDSLGDFDKTLKKEQERVAKERDAKGPAAPKVKAASGDGSQDGAERRRFGRSRQSRR